jgi:hypothetical protein
MQVTAGAPRRRSRGCLIVTIAGVVLVMACVVTPVAFLPLVMPNLAGGALDPVLRPLLGDGGGFLGARLGIETRELAGVDPGRFEPFAAFDQVRAFAGDGAELVQMRVFGVRRDGTLDLNATYTPAPDAEYRFRRRLAAPPPNAPPVGAGGAATGSWYEPVLVRVYQPGQRRQVTSTGPQGRISTWYVNRGMTKETGQPVAETVTPLPAPACSLQALWQVAIARGAPPDAVATVEYSRDGYAFTIRGTPVSLQFGPDCQPRR